MHNTLFAIFIKNPFSQTPFVFSKIKGQIIFGQDLDTLNQYDQIVAYGFEEVIDYFRDRRIEINVEVIDIKTIKKLSDGRPTSEVKGDLSWLLRGIIKNKVKQSTLKWIKDVYEMKILNPEDTPDFNKKIKDLLDAFENSYNELAQDLTKKNEDKRFFEIESKIYNIFIKTNLSGILIDHEKLDQRLNTLKKKYFRSIKELEFNFNFSSHDVNYSMKWPDISEYCPLKGFEEDFNYNFWQTVELLMENNRFLELLNSAKTSFSDYNELLKYKLDKYNRVYPKYEIVGTITSRILIKKPGIQYIKKANRDIFIPNEDSVFIYADFDQFEPGILASYSGDKVFSDLYNKRDIYNELSTIIFGTTEKRKIAKVIFLSFIYGMKKEKIQDLVRQISDEKASEDCLKFFSIFKGLEDWKKALIADAEEKGYSSSCFGNSRYLSKIGTSTSREKRWIPNQFIQGTASYILKKSILTLYNLYPNIEFLIPMHDALLIEAPKHDEDEIKEQIHTIFIDVYESICPNIKGSISFEKFSL